MIKLQSFEYRGAAMLYLTVTMSIEGGSVMFHRPFISIGGGAGITPNITVDGMSMVTRLDQWHPMELSDEVAVAVLPITCPTQEVAAKAARAFVADPMIAPHSGDEALLAWCQRYIASLQAREVASQTPR
jgi:hypothetical protein